MGFKRAIEAEISVAGVDLAWGECRPDGVCVIQANGRRTQVLGDLESGFMIVPPV